MIRRIFAAALGVLLGLALIPPIQAMRWASAVCSYDAEGVYAQQKDLGPQWTIARIEEIADLQSRMETCSEGWSLRGGFVDEDGSLAIIVNVGGDYYFLTYNPDGTLTSVGG
jgi:hypothetical protein